MSILIDNITKIYSPFYSDMLLFHADYRVLGEGTGEGDSPPPSCGNYCLSPETLQVKRMKFFIEVNFN
jgi:hypothetical protein